MLGSWKTCEPPLTEQMITGIEAQTRIVKLRVLSVLSQGRRAIILAAVITISLTGMGQTKFSTNSNMLIKAIRRRHLPILIYGLHLTSTLLRMLKSTFEDRILFFSYCGNCS